MSEQEGSMDRKTLNECRKRRQGVQRMIDARDAGAVADTILLIQEVTRWVDQIEDGLTRNVFRMYYLDGLSWAEIAEKVGRTGRPDWPRIRVRDAYLKQPGVLA